MVEKKGSSGATKVGVGARGGGGVHLSRSARRAMTAVCSTRKVSAFFLCSCPLAKASSSSCIAWARAASWAVKAFLRRTAESDRVFL